MPHLRLFLLTLFLGASISLAFADEQYVFNCDESKIMGSIKYSVIGRYNSILKECRGVIHYDSLSKQVGSVNLEIKTQSIDSDCKWCDNIVRSKQLLDAEQYPRVVFNAKDFQRDGQAYLVNGLIDLHGVTKDLNSQFTVVESADGVLSLKGVWVLRRKDFGITWNKLLDHGGVLVGDHITVDWEIKAKKINE